MLQIVSQTHAHKAFPRAQGLRTQILAVKFSHQPINMLSPVHCHMRVRSKDVGSPLISEYFNIYPADSRNPQRCVYGMLGSCCDYVSTSMKLP